METIDKEVQQSTDQYQKRRQEIRSKIGEAQAIISNTATASNVTPTHLATPSLMAALTSAAITTLLANSPEPY